MAEAIIALGRIYSDLGVPLDQQFEFAVRYNPVKGARVSSIDQFRFRLYPSGEFADTEVTLMMRNNLFRFLATPADMAADFVMRLITKMGYEHGLKVAVLLDLATVHLAKGQKVNR